MDNTEEKASKNRGKKIVIIDIINGKKENWKKVPNMLIRCDFYPEDMVEDVVSFLKSMLTVEGYYTSPLIGTKRGKVPIPRRQVLMGDEDKRYGYSGIVTDAVKWNDSIYKMMKFTEDCLNSDKESIERNLGRRITFNGAFINVYEKGDNHVSWHPDSKKGLFPYSVIASASFCATRRFSIRELNDHKNLYSYDLQNNTMLVMYHPMNEYFEHTIRQTAKKVDIRFNITFRHLTEYK